MWPPATRRWLWLLLPLSVAAFLSGATVYHYRGSYQPPAQAAQPPRPESLPSYALNVGSDTPVSRKGVLVVDNAHSNTLDSAALNTLIGKVAERGYHVEYVLRRDLTFRQYTADTRLARLEESLRRADSFAVILPFNPAFTPRDAELVQRFVDKGGRLLLVADPGHRHDINSLADRFGIVFQDGYLYNLVDNDFNYRNVFVRDFRPDPVTDGVGAVALYTAGSIMTAGQPLAFTDTNTYSSAEARVQPFAPLAKSRDGRVLALADLTFMEPPRNAALDNDRLISNIAEFLTAGVRRFDLADYPNFFSRDVDILLSRGSLLDSATALRGLLSEADIDSSVKGVEDYGRDTVFLGLYEDALPVSQYLELAGVQVGDTLRTPFTQGGDAAGTAVLLLHEALDRRVLLALADQPATLRRLVGRLETGAFRDGLVSDVLGVYGGP